MRILLLGAAAIALSGCSFLGLGGNNHASHYNQNYNANTAYNVQQARAVQARQSSCVGQCLARWNVEAAVGPEFVVGGDALTGSRANPIPDVAINDISMADAYDRGWRAELGGSYAISPNRKITATGFYAEANGNSQTIGTLGDDDDDILTGRFSDYQSYGAELGLRQYFRPQPVPGLKSVRPYVEGRLGATRLNRIELENAQLEDDVFGTGNVALYEADWVGSAAGLVGVETPLTRYSTLALETGVRFTQRPASDNSDILAGSPLSGANNGGSRLTVPVMLRGRYRF